MSFRLPSLIVGLARYGGVVALPGLILFLACKLIGRKARLVLKFKQHRWLAATDRPSGLNFFHEVIVRESYGAIAADIRGFSHPLVLDIGANCGAFALWTLSENPGARVISFEPGGAFENLVANRELFLEGERRRERTDLWQAERCAVSSVNGTARFADDPGSSMGRLTGEGGQEVPVRRIDSLDLTPEILKIDIEGHELEALKGAERTLKTTRLIVLEYHSEALHRECAAFLWEAGFEVREVPGTELLVARPS